MLWNLNKHQKTHAERKVYKCGERGKAYRQKTNLGHHQKGHTKEKHNRGQACGRAFSWESTDSRHQEIHKDKKAYECDAHGKSFKQNSALSQHENTHRSRSLTDVRTVKSFICASALVDTREHTRERNPANVGCVKRLLPRKQMSWITRRSFQG